MNSTLVLEYEFSRDGDDFGWLIAKVQTPHFSGRNGMWVQWQDVGDFAASLSTYPINADNPVLGEWGFGEQGQYTEITKVGIGPKGATGALVANVSLANYYEPENRCSTCFETDYPSLSDFREEIERMLHDRTGSAVLNGSVEIR
ncbi:hypothetical protein [Sphingomonas hengshuiensis]|uniref:Uncharacterized protein n=1 Tax=Sphingomonas hengshuiensis TaxID=1609977 RepID=A0A7U5BE20_9SPHN|nr:hypothetical protein [Sphingomonas hengshuiensis]AJP70569.1 hypothetical protein TS85_00040 [Sphingomonas hengshuiensis]